MRGGPDRGGRGHRRRVRHRGGGDRLRRGARSTRSRPIEAGAVVNANVDLGVARPAHACSGRAASPASSTSRSRRSSSSGWPARTPRTLRKGSTVTTSPRPLAGRPGAQAGGHLRADVERDRRARPRGRAACRSPGWRRPGPARGRRHDPRRRRGRPRASTSSSSTAQGADLSRGRPAQARADLRRGRSSAARSPARSATCRSRRASWRAYVQELLRRRRHRRASPRPGSRSSSTPAAASPRSCCPRLLGRLGVDVLDGQQRARRGDDPPRPRPSDAEALHRLGRAGGAPPGRPSGSTSTRSASGSRSSTRRGHVIDDERALLVVLDLVAAERREWPGRAAGHDDPGGRAGRRVPRRRDRLDRDDARRPRPQAAARAGRDLRR